MMPSLARLLLLSALFSAASGAAEARAALREGRPFDDTSRRRLEQAIKEQVTRLLGRP